jgi:hypothetical protein
VDKIAVWHLLNTSRIAVLGVRTEDRRDDVLPENRVPVNIEWLTGYIN